LPLRLVGFGHPEVSGNQIGDSRLGFAMSPPELLEVRREFALQGGGCVSPHDEEVPEQVAVPISEETGAQDHATGRPRLHAIESEIGGDPTVLRPFVCEHRSEQGLRTAEGDALRRGPVQPQQVITTQGKVQGKVGSEVDAKRIVRAGNHRCSGRLLG
jgi:hypothetical protein